MPAVVEDVDLVDDDNDDDAAFNGEAATTVVPEAVQIAARMMGDEPTATATESTMQPLLRAMSAATGTATTVTTRATTATGTSTTITSQRRMKSDTAEDHTTVGAPVFDDEDVDAERRAAAPTDVHAAIGRRAATPRAGTEVAAVPPPPPMGRPSSPQMGGLPSPNASTHGGPRPPSTPPHGSPSSQFGVPRPPSTPPANAPFPASPSAQFPAPYGPSSGQFNAQAPFETYTPSGQYMQSPYPADVSLSKFAPWRRALAFNRSSILIGGGAGILIIVVAILVLRACGG
jgi:hypothetical protein